MIGAIAAVGARVWRGPAVLGLCLVMLAGCATAPQEPVLPGESLSGRLSVRVDASPGTAAQSVSGSFELLGTPQAGRLNLISPLGTVVAQARWTGQRAVLQTSEGETTYNDLDGLTREMLGESLPVAALFDWLRGRPWPDTANQPQGAGFQQLGWDVDLSRHADGWVQARRAQPPVVTVRARLDPP